MKRLFTLFLLTSALYVQSLSAKTEAEATPVTPIAELSVDNTQSLISQEDEAKLIEIAKGLKNNEIENIQIISTSDSKGASSASNRYAYIKALIISEWFKEQSTDDKSISGISSIVDPTLKGYSAPRNVNIYGDTTMSAIASESQRVADALQAAENGTGSKDKFSWSEQMNYLYLRTNLLYFVGGLINVGMEYKKPESDFGFVLNGGYSPFSSDNWERNLGGWFVSPEVRYYIPKNDKWFVGAQFIYGGYNIKPLKRMLGRQGNVMGIGAMGGYKMDLSERFAMDFTLGLGYTKLDYDTYSRTDGKNVYNAKGVAMNKFLPIQGGINLIYKINKR